MNQRSEAIRWMRQVKGMTTQEISRHFKISTDAVHAALRRAGVSSASPRIAESATDHHRANHAAPVYRDPCTYCGTRGDIGCKHHRAAA